MVFSRMFETRHVEEKRRRNPSAPTHVRDCTRRRRRSETIVIEAIRNRRDFRRRNSKENAEVARRQATDGDDFILALREPQGDIRVTSWITAPADPLRYGHDLYANLRSLDASGAKRIVVEAPPRLPAWEAVNDRLARAAAGADEDDEP